MLDINLLQENWNNESYERRMGKTTKMLIEALQNSDFNDQDKTFFILGAHYSCVTLLWYTFLNLAKELKYPIDRVVRHRCSVNSTLYIFTTFSSFYRGSMGLGHHCEIFEDHYKGYYNHEALNYI